MNLFFLHHPAKHQRDEPREHTLVVAVQEEHNSSEGGEFLDDAIRTKEQPFMYTEECVAAGSPKGFF
jgi:hypothetical protein